MFADGKIPKREDFCFTVAFVTDGKWEGTVILATNCKKDDVVFFVLPPKRKMLQTEASGVAGSECGGLRAGARDRLAGRGSTNGNG